ncbi:RNA polymerase sigma-70 factor, ECF subfamily [Candidatus Magnetomorum sp. HK-1]|nr:RNA polymerase sigma-70 factor, ECF subfamily [Candidatus Magnetomorum sp. HK-1]
MNQLSAEQEQVLLKQIIYDNRKDLFIQEYTLLIKMTIVNTLFKFPILKDKYWNETEVEMLIHHVLVKFFESDCHVLKKYNKHKMRLSAWVKMVTSREIIDFARKEKTRLFLSLDAASPYSNDDETTVGLNIIHRKIDFEQAMKKLGKRDAEVIKYYLMGYSAKEIVDLMNLSSVNNVYKIIERSKKDIKFFLSDEIIPVTGEKNEYKMLKQ